jgi:hypothetical protein
MMGVVELRQDPRFRIRRETGPEYKEEQGHIEATTVPAQVGVYCHHCLRRD